MNTPTLSPRARNWFLTGGALCASLSFTAIAQAAAPVVAKPSIYIDVTKGQSRAQTTTGRAGSGTTTTPTGNRGGMAGNIGGNMGGRGGSSETTSNDVFFTIAISNNSKVPASNVEVEYHVFDKSVLHNGTNVNTTVSDTTETKTFEKGIPANGKESIETIHVAKKTTTSTSTTTSAPSGGNRRTSSSASSTTSNIDTVSPIGIWIVVKIDGAVAKEYQDPDTTLDQVNRINKANGITKVYGSKPL